MQTEINTGDVPTRVVPNPPGGGSWTFDEASWRWIPNDSNPAPQPVAVGDNAAPANTEQE